MSPTTENAKLPPMLPVYPYLSPCLPLYYKVVPLTGVGLPQVPNYDSYGEPSARSVQAYSVVAVLEGGEHAWASEAWASGSPAPYSKESAGHLCRLLNEVLALRRALQEGRLPSGSSTAAPTAEEPSYVRWEYLDAKDPRITAPRRALARFVAAWEDCGGSPTQAFLKAYMEAYMEAVKVLRAPEA